MSHAKETPRQKMISLMYLVLTCLLALNVSREVLLGFVTINDSIETTNVNFSDNTATILKAIDDAIAMGHHEFGPYYNKSKQVSAFTESTFNYVEGLKKALIQYTEDKKGADTLQLSEVESLDDYDKPTYFLLGPDETRPKTGTLSATELKAKLILYADSLNGMLDHMKDATGLKLPEKDYLVLKDKLKLLKPHDNWKDKEGLPLTWELKNFYNQPLAAVITNLSKIQGDLRNMEGEMVNVFASAPGKLAVKFNQLQARVVPQSQYIQAGADYRADVFLSAASTDFKEDNLQFILGEMDTASGKLLPGAIVLPVDSGTGKISIPTSAIGDKEVKGWIKFREGTGHYRYLPYRNTYVVANSAVAVSADNMNLFYAGIDNPVTVSAAGVAPQDLIVNISGCDGQLTGSGNGHFMARVKGTGKCSVTVYKRTDHGMEKQGSAQMFRVKKIPDPLVKVNSKLVTGTVDFALAEARSIAYVTIDNSNFNFNVPFEVTSFMISFAGPRVSYEEFRCDGNALSPAARAAISRITKGGKIYIEDIKIKAPDGARTLSTVKINVK